MFWSKKEVKEEQSEVKEEQSEVNPHSFFMWVVGDATYYIRKNDVMHIKVHECNVSLYTARGVQFISGIYGSVDAATKAAKGLVDIISK